jgi:hypothetical protein
VFLADGRELRARHVTAHISAPVSELRAARIFSPWRVAVRVSGHRRRPRPRGWPSCSGSGPLPCRSSGPYFDFGFLTTKTWKFSEAAVTLSVVPGLAAALGGLMLLRPLRSLGGLGRLLVFVCAVWLLVGPSLYPIWADGQLQPLAGADWKRALLWIGYFYGVGALLALFVGYVQGLVTRRQWIEETQVAEPQFERVVTEG